MGKVVNGSEARLILSRVQKFVGVGAEAPFCAGALGKWFSSVLLRVESELKKSISF